ncbi:hypothetical protein OB905_00630 [Halobacteria archaeon AArc-dxtr1]|nr:hypothetical protein [Halobacteria archaeon AArc-dxtr1]
MATTDESVTNVTEVCDDCGVETIHEVSVEIRTESLKPENAQFSREPYRVTECHRCGSRRKQRMNNA